MPYLGADAMVQAGRVAAIPGLLGLILGTAYSAAADRMDPVHWEGNRACNKVQWAMDREPELPAAGGGRCLCRQWWVHTAGQCCVHLEAFALAQFPSHAQLPGL